MRRAAILLYHIIDNPKNEAERRYCCSPARFEQQMRYLVQSGHSLVSLTELVASVNGRRPLPENAVAITFDDGFRCNYETAAPVLHRYGIPAMMFIVTGRVGETNEWMSARSYPRRHLLAWSEIRELNDAGIGIGSHTVSHPDLTDLGDQEIAKELFDSKRVLEDRLGNSIDFLAYPYGKFDPSIRELVKVTGYVAACSTQSGFNSDKSDRFGLRRIEVFYDDSLRCFRRKLRFGVNRMSWLEEKQYYAERLVSRLISQT